VSDDRGVGVKLPRATRLHYRLIHIIIAQAVTSDVYQPKVHPVPSNGDAGLGSLNCTAFFKKNISSLKIVLSFRSRARLAKKERLSQTPYYYYGALIILD
jgi:hypothetical protein